MAEKYNDPGHFTALIGYEWSSTTGGNNLHRVVVFRDNAEKANQVVNGLIERAQSTLPVFKYSQKRASD